MNWDTKKKKKIPPKKKIAKIINVFFYLKKNVEKINPNKKVYPSDRRLN